MYQMLGCGHQVIVDWVSVGPRCSEFFAMVVGPALAGIALSFGSSATALWLDAAMFPTGELDLDLVAEPAGLHLRDAALTCASVLKSFLSASGVLEMYTPTRLEDHRRRRWSVHDPDRL